MNFTPIFRQIFCISFILANFAVLKLKYVSFYFYLMKKFLSVGDNMRRIFKDKPARAGLIGALYLLLSLALQPLTFGPLQFRVAEALTVLPLVFPEAIFGLSIGCFFTNLTSPFGILDWGLGTLATFLAACLTHYLRKKPILALSMPVIINALVVGFYVSRLSSLPYSLTAFYIGASQAIIVYLVGWPLLKILSKNPIFNQIKN